MKRSSNTCLLLVLAAGCGNGNTSATTGPSAWEQAKHAYRIVGVSRTNVPRIGEQKRTTQLICPTGMTREQVLVAAREASAALIQEIQEAQPDAAYKSVTVTAFDSENDLKLDRKAWLCQLRLSPAKGESFPSDIDSSLQWQWREAGEAPTLEERQLEWDYLEAIAEVDANEQFGVSDAEVTGLNGVQRRAYIEKRYPDDADAIKDELAVNHKMTREEVQAALDRVLRWKFPETGPRPGGPSGG